MKLILLYLLTLNSCLEFQNFKLNEIHIEKKIRQLIDESKIDKSMFSEKILLIGFKVEKSTIINNDRFTFVKKELQVLFFNTDYIINFKNNKLYILNHNEKIILFFNSKSKLYKLEKVILNRPQGAPLRY